MTGVQTCALPISRDPQVAWILDETMYLDLESGKRCKAGSIKVPAGGYRWLYKTFK